ncbi:MAG: (2Fe-2S)-binding protein [Emcibacteraceae bacterium]|nr:(2Fe-2S)-binding protein [Emcibacteraceae bacterium]MDG1857513.1 (2Fe-2S)-binding protein [Emcibacteraceae bacterium]
MYVCVCNALNENTVREAARKNKGSQSVVKVYETLGVKPQCGMCLCDAQDICNSERQEFTAS